MSDAGRAVATNVRSAIQTSLNGNTLRSAGVNAMAGLKAVILAGRFGVISAMRSAREAVNTAKEGTENQESFAGVSGRSRRHDHARLWCGRAERKQGTGEGHPQRFPIVSLYLLSRVDTI